MLDIGGRARFSPPMRRLLASDLEQRRADDPERTFVIYMCLYARDVLDGRLPGPYSDDDARIYARACLIPAELAEREDLDVDRAADALHVPAIELTAARHDRMRTCVR